MIKHPLVILVSYVKCEYFLQLAIVFYDLMVYFYTYTTKRLHYFWHIFTIYL